MTTINRSISILLSITLALVLVLPASAQPLRGQKEGDRAFDDKREAIEARKIAFITRQLSLTPAEAQDFWPIYNEYNARVEQISGRFKEVRDQLPEPQDMNKEQAAQYVEAEVRRFEEAAALRREYSEKMLEVISVQKLAMLFEAERGFNRMLFREAQRRHRQNGREGRN